MSQDRRHLRMTVLMTPDLANFAGKVHGGALLKHLDQVAYACASRYCGHYVVTLAVDEVVFKEPVQVGELVTFVAQVNYTGRTSMEIGIRVIAEDPRARKSREALTCFFTMVAMDEAGGKPTAVPQLAPASDEDRRAFEAAKLRRALKAEFEARLKAGK